MTGMFLYIIDSYKKDNFKINIYINQIKSNTENKKTRIEHKYYIINKIFNFFFQIFLQIIHKKMDKFI